MTLLDYKFKQWASFREETSVKRCLKLPGVVGLAWDPCIATTGKLKAATQNRLLTVSARYGDCWVPTECFGDQLWGR